MAIKNITVPDLGGSTDVTVIEVLVKPGDEINVDMSIVTLESDKATMEVPSTDAGKVKELKVKVGDKVASGSVLLTLESSAEVKKPEAKQAGIKPTEIKQAEVKPPKSEETQKREERESPALKAEETAETLTPATKALSGIVQSDSDVHAGPGVRRLARELGVNLSLVAGNGPKQRILKEDIEAYVKSQLRQVQTGGAGASFAPLPTIDFAQFGAIETLPLSRIKKISGKNLQRNWMMIPHVTQFGEADITALEEFRQTQKKHLDKEKIRLTPLVFVMKAVVASLKAFPQFNASFDSSGENLIIKNYYHLGVAVDTPDGLVVPVIRDVDKKGMVDLAKELATVSEKARNKQLVPKDMQGGCFSISSLGGIGGTSFTPIINAPEVAILGVSKIFYKPHYQEGTFVPRLMMPLSLSYDHRAIDGADGARFIVHLTELLGDIRGLLL